MNILEHLQPTTVVPLHLLGFDVSLTNSALTGLLAATIVVLFFYVVSRRAKPVPSLSQNAAEILVQFVRDEMLAPLGKEGESWLPFLVSLFSFILACNLLGLIPGLLPPTSNLNFTATLAIIVFLIVQTAGIVKHGVGGYLRAIVPPGLPWPVAAFLFPVEIIGQLARPFSLAVRLFANMFAGHAIILMLISLIFIFHNHFVIPLPVLGNVMILAFEIFVSLIQAFIFTYLSASYIVGALQTEH
ncbi:MAG: F0F1 ATP synthase subunit A [Candidatus Margulisiibacteriota bacterium]